MIYHGDCLDVLRVLADNSVDAVVTDPPYGLNFMFKRWDYDVPSEEIWRECLRVLKPGGHLLSFAGTRTQHRMVVRIEDAGFEIRDMIAWVYSTGFPKSHNLKDEWKGFGTALKPALEPITVSRKPLTGTVAENVQRWGCGALNIDGCRVEAQDGTSTARTKSPNSNSVTYAQDVYTKQMMRGGNGSDIGRWPANLIHDGSDDVVGLFPNSKSCNSPSSAKPEGRILGGARSQGSIYPGETGSAARFFYCAKASKRDRDEGLEGFESVHRVNGNKWTDQNYRVTNGERPPSAESGPRKNVHPTVKPTDLMRYLVRLVTPPGGTVLDPFAGSGSTGKACALEGFEFIGIEREAEYCKIAEARIAHAQRREGQNIDLFAALG